MYACHRPGHSTQQAPVTYAQNNGKADESSFLFN